LTSFLKAGYNGVVDGTAMLFNAKDRKELVKKLPVSLVGGGGGREGGRAG
jgi:hypothetical protein